MAYKDTYRQKRAKMTEDELRRKHQKEDSDAYLFDVEYEKLKKEQEEAEREYEAAREEYLKLSEELREEMANGTASETDFARFMAALTDRGVQLQEEQTKMQEQIEKLGQNRADIENQMNELRKKAFSGSTHAYEAADMNKDYKGFKFDSSERKYQNAKIVEMSPEEYLRRVAFDVKGTGMRDLLNKSSAAEIEKYARKMLRGTRFGPSSLNYKNGTTKGDARVWAALLNGYGKIPVMVIE